MPIYSYLRYKHAFIKNELNKMSFKKVWAEIIR